ncbi:MAG: polymer-forming cytoskeletal protein [Candidatus Krumholzibacteria bacterium]|nr:polymer-forming cytoskeletal protein [Candidatus Krumholzibacteria bacterium]
MFGKEADAVTGGEGNLNSILGPGCKVKGNIDLKGTLRIDGDFDGEIKCPETLIIGKSGVVKADVNVKNAVIGGKLVGNITATNKIELQTGSHVEGDIATARLVIDEGVFFEGACKMGTQAGAPASTAKPVSEKQTWNKETQKQALK